MLLQIEVAARVLFYLSLYLVFGHCLRLLTLAEIRADSNQLLGVLHFGAILGLLADGADKALAELILAFLFLQ